MISVLYSFERGSELEYKLERLQIKVKQQNKTKKVKIKLYNNELTMKARSPKNARPICFYSLLSHLIVHHDS